MTTAPRKVKGRRWRTVTAAAVIALVAAGSLWGADDQWPFAPFRMYASASRLDGRVLKAEFVAQTRHGYRWRLKPGWVGLRPAEVEGQLPLALPRHLPSGTMRDLAMAWNATHNRQIVRFELRLRGYRLRDGKPAGPLDELIEVWSLPR